MDNPSPVRPAAWVLAVGFKDGQRSRRGGGHENGVVHAAVHVAGPPLLDLFIGEMNDARLVGNFGKIYDRVGFESVPEHLSVELHGSWRSVQRAGDVRTGDAQPDQPEHFELADADVAQDAPGIARGHADMRVVPQFEILLSGFDGVRTDADGAWGPIVDQEAVRAEMEAAVQELQKADDLGSAPELGVDALRRMAAASIEKRMQAGVR